MCGRRASAALRPPRRPDSRTYGIVLVWRGLGKARSNIRANPYVFTHIEPKYILTWGGGRASCYWKPSNRHEKLKWFRQSRQKYGKRTATISYIKYLGWKNWERRLATTIYPES